jgi:thymidylate synthase (FAD)
MQVTYLDHFGSDLTVVNAARVSFKKKSELHYYCRPGAFEGKYSLKTKDAKLLSYLASHKHELPFAHPHVQIHVKAPIFVARQLAKHQVGFVWSEVSRRYVTEIPEFYEPNIWRKAAPDKKQGSLNEEVDDNTFILGMPDLYNSCLETYSYLLGHGVAPEQARMVLPQNMYTEWQWTGSLLGWARVYRLRAAEDAQAETREIAEQIGEIMSGLFPVSWKVLTDG